MKQVSKKKGFSLIELIVVIAVIAAIAAVIVPQFSNISGAAKVAADKRNVQMWNEVYANAYAIVGNNSDTTNFTVGSFLVNSATTAAEAPVPAIDVHVNISGQSMNFNAPSFNFVSSGTTWTFSAGKGFANQ